MTTYHVREVGSDQLYAVCNDIASARQSKRLAYARHPGRRYRIVMVTLSARGVPVGPCPTVA